MDNFLYCITCERIVPDWGPEKISYHMNLDDNGDLLECYGPFAYSTPPNDLPENWNEMVQEPSPEELAEMDTNAGLLLADLEMENGM